MIVSNQKISNQQKVKIQLTKLKKKFQDISIFTHNQIFHCLLTALIIEKMQIKEETIDDLFSHHHFILKLREYIEEVTKPEEENVPSQQVEPLERVIEQINTAIIGLSQPSFMKDIQQMKMQLNSKYTSDLEEVKQQILAITIEEMKKYCEEQIEKAVTDSKPRQDLLLLVSNESGSIGKSSEEDGTPKRRKTQHHRLKAERKILTQSILECSRIEGSEKHIIQHGDGLQSMNQQISSEVNKTQAINWHQTSVTLKNRLKQVEEECLKKHVATNKWNIDKGKQIDQLYRDMTELRVQVMDKVESAFAGVWNIVSNLQQKFLTLQALVSRIKK